jgi:hypothetical protein
VLNTFQILRQSSHLNLKNVYRGILEFIERAKNCLNPDVISEQFRLLFRDESKTFKMKFFFFI